MLMNRRRLQLNHLKKRMVIVLSTLLVLSSLVPLPVSVKAETTQFSEVIVDGDKYPLTTDGLKTAITDTETNGKIYINGDIPITEMITISKSITIDGNAVSTLKRDSAYKGQLIKIDDNTTAKIERLIIDGANISSVGELINISTLTSSLLVGAKTSLIHNMNSAIINAGTLTFNGGEISENVNTGTGSAGIVNKGTLTINGGTFSKNITEGNGGAIYNDGTLNISNGQIISNQAKIGGGVYNNNYKSFNFSGGNIEANNATEKGGGVYQEGSGFTISKTASVVRNVVGGTYEDVTYTTGISVPYMLTGGKASNIYVANNSAWGSKIVVDQLSSSPFTGAIGVTYEISGPLSYGRVSDPIVTASGDVDLYSVMYKHIFVDNLMYNTTSYYDFGTTGSRREYGITDVSNQVYVANDESGADFTNLQYKYLDQGYSPLYGKKYIDVQSNQALSVEFFFVFFENFNSEGNRMTVFSSNGSIIKKQSYGAFKTYNYPKFSVIMRDITFDGNNTEFNSPIIEVNTTNLYLQTNFVLANFKSNSSNVPMIKSTSDDSKIYLQGASIINNYTGYTVSQFSGCGIQLKGNLFISGALMAGNNYAIYMSESNATATMNGGMIVGNHPLGSQGGAISIANATSKVIVNSGIISYNHSNESTSAIEPGYYGSVELNGGLINHNKTLDKKIGNYGALLANTKLTIKGWVTVTDNILVDKEYNIRVTNNASKGANINGSLYGEIGFFVPSSSSSSSTYFPQYLFANTSTYNATTEDINYLSFDQTGHDLIIAMKKNNDGIKVVYPSPIVSNLQQPTSAFVVGENINSKISKPMIQYYDQNNIRSQGWKVKKDVAGAVYTDFYGSDLLHMGYDNATLKYTLMYQDGVESDMLVETNTIQLSVKKATPVLKLEITPTMSNEYIEKLTLKPVLQGGFSLSGNIVQLKVDGLDQDAKLESGTMIDFTPAERDKEYTFLATYEGDANNSGATSVEYKFTFNKKIQDFLTLSSSQKVRVGDPYSINVNGGSTSGDMSYQLIHGTTGEATIENNILTITRAGEIQFSVTKEGNSIYNPITQLFTIEAIDKKVSDITFTNAEKTVPYCGENIGFSDADVAVTGTDGALSYKYYTNDSGTLTSTSDSSGATKAGGAPKNAGTYYVKASVAGNEEYSSTTTANYAKLVIDKVILTPTIKTIASKDYDGNKNATGTLHFTGAVKNEQPVASATFEWDSKNALTTKEVTLNRDTNKVQKTRLKKEAIVNNQEDEYASSLEVIDKRTSNSKTYKLPDGTYVNDTYFEPVHKKEGEAFVDIDNTLENTSKLRSKPIYENKDGLYTFKLEDKTASITNEKDQTLSIINKDVDLTTYDVNENIILYSEVYENIDMEYRLHGNAVATNFFINGLSSQKEMNFTINKGNLKVKEETNALLFLDDKDSVVYSYTKPFMYDGKDQVRATTFSFVEEKENVNVKLVLDNEWMNDSERIYPIMMSNRAADESAEINIDTAYNRSASPNITSTYYDLYVGYEDGSTSGGTLLGVTRSYVRISGMNLGADKEIVSGTLKMWKRAKYSNQWNTLSIGKTNGYIEPKDATWNNRPAVTQMTTVNIREDAGWQDFNVTSYVEDIYKGKNNTIEIKATNESSAYTPNVFSSESGTGLPKLTVTYKDAFDINPNLPIDTFDTEMRIFSILDKGWEAFSFDGIARPDSQVVFDLVERGKDDVIQSEASKGNANKYFVDPIYITNYLANTQKYSKADANYTTDYIYKNRIPKFDTPYEYKVKVKSSNSTSTKEFRTDSFIKYKVKNGDNLKNLASYYGLTIDEIKEDNHLKNTNIIKEDDVLLLRFKKNNDKVSKDIYTPPVRTIDYKAKYVNRGPRCSGGICPVIDPVNSTTGNYYYEGIDFSVKDADDFDFYRYYNSTGPQLSNMFGNGFTTPIESYISYDKNGNILYFAGDGKIFEFKKTASGFEARPQDKMEITSTNEKVTIKDLDTEDTYQFDVYGYLEKITSKEGIVTTITYDNYGLITAIKVGEKTITFTYNESKLVKNVTLPNSAITSYKYDANRNLIEFIDTKGNIKKYTYDNNNYLKSITDKNGNVVTQNTYDNEGRVTKQIDGNGNASTLTYGDHKTTIVNADGSTDVYHFNEQYDTLSIVQDGKITSKNTYDENRNITSSTDEDGKVTKHTYDNRNNVIKIEYPDGTYEEYKYDGNNNIIYQRDKEGNITENTFSGNDLVSTQDSKKTNMSYVYDDKRRVTKETNQFGVLKSYTYIGNMISSISHSNGLIESFEYDANGNTVKESDNQGKTTTYVYNVNNEMTQKNYYDGTNEKWTYDANGNISIYQDRIGGVTTNTYDKNNNLIKSVNGNLTTHKTYNEMNQLISETDVQGLVKTYTYDIHGNMASETDAYGNTTKYEYDASNNITKTIDAHGNEESNTYEDGNLISSTGKDGLTTTYEYDSLNREIKKINPNGTIETKTYKGLLLVEEKDGKDTKIEHFYDAYDREIKTITTYTDGIVSTTQNTYDIYGNIVETNVDGVITKNTYDVYKQLISITDGLGNITKKEYDLDGNVTEEIDALGNATITKYDGNQNIISITDKNGNTETKVYNTSGQLISETDALGFVKTYTYNNKGQVVQVNDPYNKKVTYKYDEYGNQIEAKLENQIIETKEFDQFGREIYVQTLEARTSTKYDTLDRKIETTNDLTGLITYTMYDEFGNVIEEKDSEGLSTTYEYDNYNRKVKTTDAYGRIEEISYDVHDHAISTKAFDGTESTSKYDAKGNLVESKDALGKVTMKTYDALNRVIKEEAGSKITETIYDANGQVVEVKNKNNNTSTKNVYDKNGNVIEAVDAFGNSVKTEYDAKNQVIATIDANGNRSSKEYDAYGNVIKEIDALGHTKQKVFNVYGLVEKEVDERGFDVTYEYNDDLLVNKITDSKGYMLSVEYNEKLQKIKETNANDGITEYEYDAYGREIKVTAPNGKITEKEYDALGNIIKERSGKKVTKNKYDELGRLTKTSINDVVQVKNEYNKLNQIVKTYDANKNVSTFKYDNNNLVIYSDEKGFISEKEYDVDGNVIKQIDNKTYITENIYDSANRIIETKVNGKTTLIKAYDPNGNEIKTIENGAEVRKSYNEVNHLFKVEIPSSLKEDEFVAIQTIEYDESGNPRKITDANGNVEEKKYDANNNVIEEINKNGIKTLYEFDGLNNVIKVQNHEDRYVQYAYDKANNLTIKNINNKYAENTYDEDGNLLSEENEYGYKSRYTYDTFGKKVEEIKPDGTSIKYTYDHLGNKLSENENTFTYDSRNNVISSTNKEGTVKNTYDAFNNKTSVTDTKGKEVSYVFNADNKVSSMKYAGVEVTYLYNDKGLLDTVKKDNTLIAKYEYNNRNEVIQLNQNNTITNKTYDDMGRVLTQTSVKDGKSVLDASYSYDANDNVIKEIIDGQTNTYEFDAYDELIKSSKYVNGKKVDTTYKHDVFGNQVENSSSEGEKVFKYNDKNQVKSIETDKGIIKYSYDDNGNVSKKINEDGRVDLYTYDDLNQLTKLEQGQFTYDYKYDAEKERISQKWTDTKDYHYDQWYNYSEPLDVVSDLEIEDTFKNLKEQAKKKQGNGNTCTSILSDKYDVMYYKEPKDIEYILDRNQEYTQVLTSNDTVNVYGDTLLQSNNESIITAKNESVVAKVTSQDIKKISYSDYGQTNDIKSGNGYNSETLDQTGLIYLRARYYDPSVSRFVQIDNNYDGEKQSIASQNKYVYTMNNPYKYVDRNGNWSLWGAVKNVVKKVVNTVAKTVTKVAKTVVKAVVAPFSPSLAKSITKTIDKVSKQVSTFIDGIGGNKTNGKGGGSKPSKPPVKKVKVEAKCPIKLLVANSDTEEGKQINTLCDSLYKKYKEKFEDSGRLDAIKGVIDELRDEGLKSLDVEKVKETCKSYEKKLRLPSYTTDGGVTYLTKSYVSLENSLISDAFVSDCSKIGEYRFTLNINEYCGNGFGVQVSAVSFSAGLPSFNTECFKLKLSLCLDLVSISYKQSFSDFIFVEVGGFIGLGGEVGFSFDVSQSELSFVSKQGLIVGFWLKGGINVIELLSF